MVLGQRPSCVSRTRPSFLAILSFWGFIARLLSLCGVVALAFATARSGSADIVRGAGTARPEGRREEESGSG